MFCNIWIFLFFVTNGYAYRFLGLFPTPIKSHFFVYEKLMQALAEKGHEVHVVSYFPQRNNIPRYKHFNVTNDTGSFDLSVEDGFNMKIWNIIIRVLLNYRRFICDNIMKQPEIQKLKNSEVKYDAIIIEVYGSDCLIGFAHSLNTSIIGITSTMDLPWANDRIGNPNNPLYTPNYFVPRKETFGILERIELVIVGILSKIAYYCLSTIPSEIIAKDFFGNGLPSLDTLVYNTSLLLTNTHFLINGIKPKIPRLIEVGGMHIEKPKSLPESLSRKVETSKNGIVYFSMGTVVNMNSFPKEKLKHIVDAFAELPYTILWKGLSTHFPNKLPPNFIVRDWLPQLDILCHPKTKLFVTHGGQLSILESLYCGVPILGIPQFPDHTLNIRSFQKHGAGLILEYSSINKESILNSLNSLLRNDTYKMNAAQLSLIFKDRPANSVDSAVFWVEYVARHNGASHLKTQVEEFEYYLIDSGVLFTFLGFAIATVISYIIMTIQDYLDSRNITSYVFI